MSDAQGTTSKDQQTLRSPCEQGLLPSPASRWKGEPSKSRLTCLIWLPRHNFRLPKLRQGGKICFLATPPIPGSEQHPLNPGSERNGRIYTEVCMELSSLEVVKPQLWQQAGSPQTPGEKREPKGRYAGRDAYRRYNHSFYSLHTIRPIFLAIQMLLSLLNLMAASFTS